MEIFEFGIPWATIRQLFLLISTVKKYKLTEKNYLQFSLQILESISLKTLSYSPRYSDSNISYLSGLCQTLAEKQGLENAPVKFRLYQYLLFCFKEKLFLKKNVIIFSFFVTVLNLQHSIQVSEWNSWKKYTIPLKAHTQKCQCYSTIYKCNIKNCKNVELALTMIDGCRSIPTLCYRNIF